MSSGLQMSRRIRRTPYTDQVEALGVSGFTVVNHTLLPKAFQHTVEDDYWHLRQQVQLWDVGCQRQVELRGPDAARLLQWMSPRDLRQAVVGDCLYTPLIDRNGYLVNDPILIKLADNHFWLSIADSDVALFAHGLAAGAGLDVDVQEPDIWPFAVQGPKADALMAELFGETVRQLGHFKFTWVPFDGQRCLIARSGYSGQGGFEVYATSHQGPALWEAVWSAGQAMGIRPGCPNLIDRIESGLLSFGNDMTRANHPLECGLARWCNLNADIDCLGLPALRKLAEAGSPRKMRGVQFDAPACPTCMTPWPVISHGKKIGEITSAIHSPRFQANVGVGMLSPEFSTPGLAVTVVLPSGEARRGTVQALPFPAQSTQHELSPTRVSTQ